jgi:hypothetical protein
MKKTVIALFCLVLFVGVTNAQAVLGQAKPAHATVTDARTSATTKKFKKIKTANFAKGNVKLKAGVIPPAKDGKMNDASNK